MGLWYYKKVIKCSLVLLVVCSTFSLVQANELIWTQKANMPTARWGLAVGVVNNKIYAIGGYSNGSSINTVEEYDPNTDTWTIKTSMPTSRYELSVGVVNNKIYAIGGWINGGWVSTVEEYNPATNTWTTKASMPTARSGLVVAVVNNKIYAIGGEGGSNVVEEYDPTTNIWITKTSMPTSRRGMGGAVVNNKIYIIGGINSSTVLSTVEEYDPINDRWSTKDNILTERYFLAAAAAGNEVYVFGGVNGMTTYDKVEEYNTAKDVWTAKTSMMKPSMRNAACVIDGNIYVAGGQNGGVIFNTLYKVYVDTKSYVLDHYEVVAPTNVVVGSSFNITVNAKNNTNDTIPNISGTINLKPLIYGTTQQGAGRLGAASITLSSGTATLTTQSYNKSEIIQIEASDSNGTKGLSSQIEVVPTVPGNISVSANPSSIIKGQYATVTATLKDNYDSKIANKTVNFRISVGSGTFNFSTLQSTSAITNSEGQASVLLTVPNGLNCPQTASVVAEYDTLSATSSVGISVLVVSQDGGVVMATEDPKTRILIPSNAFVTDVSIDIKYEVDLSTALASDVNSALNTSSYSLMRSIKYIEAKKNSDGTEYNGTLSQLVTIEFPYTDSNADGIADAPRFKANRAISYAPSSSLTVNALKVFRLNEVTNQFEIVNDGGLNTVDIQNGVVKAQVNKLGVFTIGARAPELDLSKAKVFPNPFKPAIHTSGVTINGLTANAKLKIYNIAGELVRELNDSNGDGEIIWDGKNSDNSLVASGMYIAFVEGTNEKKKLKIGVVK